MAVDLFRLRAGSCLMDERRPNPGAGQKLKALRVRLGLSTRDVQRESAQIAAEKRNQEYYLSHGWLTDIERGKFTPSIFKLYSMSAIYHLDFRKSLRTSVSRSGTCGATALALGCPEHI